jgi:hypothetical protein
MLICGDGHFVASFVLGMSGMPFYMLENDSVPAHLPIEFLPEVDVLDCSVTR